jgi:hypothetical protein
MTFDVKSAARQRQSSDRWMISCNAIHTVTHVKYLWREFGQPIQSTLKAKGGDINESSFLLLPMPNLRVMEKNHGWDL